MEIVYTKAAIKALRNMQPKKAAAIRDAIQEFAADPNRTDNNVKSLVGIDGGIRIRVGDWRVSILLSERIINIVEIAARGSAYR